MIQRILFVSSMMTISLLPNHSIAQASTDFSIKVVTESSTLARFVEPVELTVQNGNFEYLIYVVLDPTYPTLYGSGTIGVALGAEFANYSFDESMQLNVTLPHGLYKIRMRGKLKGTTSNASIVDEYALLVDPPGTKKGVFIQPFDGNQTENSGYFNFHVIGN